MNLKEQPWSAGCFVPDVWIYWRLKNILMRSEAMTSVCVCSAFFHLLFGLSLPFFASDLICSLLRATLHRPITATTQRPSSLRSLRVCKSLSSSWAHGHIYVVAVRGRSGFSICSAVLWHHRLLLLFDYHVQKIWTSASEAHPHARSEWIDVY